MRMCKVCQRPSSGKFCSQSCEAQHQAECRARAKARIERRMK